MESTDNKVSRKKFIRLASITTAAFTIGFATPGWAKKLGKIVTGNLADELGFELNNWISIDKLGKVTILNHRCEMGQGSFQSVPQIIAEELEVNLADVTILFAQGHQTKYGSQVTGGSSTIRNSYKKLLQTGATAREMLISAAAAKWKVNKSTCYAKNGFVLNKTNGEKLGYGDLVEDAAKLTPPENVKLKHREDYTTIGKPLARQDNPDKINGKTQFGLDVKLKGMLYAVVERNPRFLGKVKSFDDSGAKKIPGVKNVFKVLMPVFSTNREGIVVVADSFWAATQGRKALKIEWDDTGFEHINTEQLYARMKEDVKKPGLSVKTVGDAERYFNNADTKVEAIYETPYESHSCMEPLCCTVHYTDAKCEVWGPIQGADWVQKDLSERLKMPVEKIIVNMTFLGGGFGRKAFIDYTAEAALISKEMKAPVQTIWTREDDMTQGPFRPGAVYSCKGGMDKEGNIKSFQAKMASQDIDFQNSPQPDKFAYNSNTTEGFAEAYFNSIPHYSFADIPTESPIPVMWWRSVYSSTNGFAYESFIDEMAIAAKKDPLQFRKDHLGDNDRYKVILEMLEEKAKWKDKAKNDGWGIAVTECFKSIVGEAVKVSKDADGKIKIDKVIAVMDCGWYVNPDIIKAQVEGSIVMALGAAVTHETHFLDGKAVETNFHQYRMPRMNEMPQIEVHIVENDEKAGGVGEPGLPPFAPALCNAIFDLTGKRIRKLPFDLAKI